MPVPTPSVTCPRCGKRFRVQGGKPGRQFRCPTAGCGHMLALPGPAPDPEVLDLDETPPPVPPAPPPVRPAPQPRMLVPEDLDDDEAAPGTPAFSGLSTPSADDLDDDDDAPRRPRKSSRNWVLLGVAVVGVLGAAAGAGYWFLGGRPAGDGGDGAAGAGSGGDPGTAPGGTPGSAPSGAASGGAPVTASGPRVKLLEKLPDSIKVRKFYLIGEFGSGGGFGAPKDDWPQLLPTGTESFHVGIAFEFEPPDGTGLKVETVTESGTPVKSGGGLMMTLRGPEGTVVELAESSVGGPYPDGRYRTTIKIADKPAAVLNWAVGGRVAGVPAAGLKGTKWRQRGSSPDSATRLEFKADGTLVLEESWKKGAKQTGKWQADGEVFTGQIDRPKEDGGRAEYRGQCLKAELSVRSRRTDGSWYAMGVFVPDDGKAAPPKPAGKDVEVAPPPK